jgi:hypothetical protein
MRAWATAVIAVERPPAKPMPASLAPPGRGGVLAHSPLLDAGNGAGGTFG